MHWSIRYDNDDVWKVHTITTLPDRYKIYLRVNNAIQSNCVDLSRIDDFTGTFGLDYGVKGGYVTAHTLSDIVKLLKVMAPMFSDSTVYAILDSNGKITSMSTVGNQMWPIQNWTSLRPPGISTTIGTFAHPTPIILTR